METFAQIVQEYNVLRQCPDKGSICHAPESSMYFGRDGMVSACCYNRSGSWGSYPVNSIAEIWSSAQAKSMRQSMRRNELPLGCSLCADQLIAGNFDGLLARQFDQNARSPILPRLPESQHTDGNGRYPVRLEFELSNKCNLECTMCSGFFSSSIRANRENLPPLPQLYGKEFVEQLLPFLPHLTQAKFLGGEPFLVDIYYDIWEKLIELNPLCQVSITTNGTVFTEKVRRVLEKLNCVIVVSLDSVNQASYESIRRNASLERTLHNVEIFSKINRLSGRSLSIATCPMVSNWREIPEVISWASRLGMRVFLNTVVFPAAHSLKALQVTAQREVIEVYRSWSPELRSEVDYANRETLESFCRQIEYWIAESTPGTGEERSRSPMEERYRELLASPEVSASERCFLLDLLGRSAGVEGPVSADVPGVNRVRELRDYFHAIWDVGATLQSEGRLGRLNFDRKELENLARYLDESLSPGQAARILHEVRRFSGQMFQFAGSVPGSRIIEMMEQHLSAGGGKDQINVRQPVSPEKTLPLPAASNKQTTANQLPDSRKVVFFHVPHTGGTTFRGILSSIYRDKFHLCEDPSIDALAEDVAGFDCLELHTMPYAGRSGFAMHAELVRQKRWDLLAGCDVFTMLRHPVDLTVSHYFYLLKNRDLMEPGYRAGGVPFPETLQQYVDFPWHHNYQLVYLSAKYELTPHELPVSKDLEDIKGALRRLRTHFGVMERYSDSLHVFERVTGRRISDGKVEIRNRNASRRPMDGVPDSIREQIRRQSSLDMELYEFARELLEQDIQEFGSAKTEYFNVALPASEGEQT